MTLPPQILNILEKHNLLAPVLRVLNSGQDASLAFKLIQNLIKKEDMETDEEEIFLETEDYLTNSLQISKPKVASSDPISAMFDIQLDEDISSFSRYQPQSWQVPSYNWSSLDKLNETVILYRTHSQSRSIEESFLKHKVPYRLVSGVRFLDRKEIKDVMAILRFLVNSQDKISLSRFLPLIFDGVGAKTVEKMLAFLEDYEYPLGPKYQSMLLDMISMMQNVWSTSDNLIDLTKNLLVDIGYFRYLKSVYPTKEELEVRIENIGEMYSLMFPFDEDKSVPLSERLNQFLIQVSLMSNLETDEGDKDKTPKINLMSLHQSKGLEFESVFLIGCEDGLLPHSNSFFENKGMEEEVRLAYVGVTRAKKHLHLISCDTRVMFGQIKANPVSRIFRPFLDTHIKRRR